MLYLYTYTCTISFLIAVQAVPGPAPPAPAPQDGLALEFASLELQKDEGIALEAVKSNTAGHPDGEDP